MNIINIEGKEIKDSRGKPTLEVTVFAGGESASFQVPSGASTGSFEAYELRDEETGGMNKAISAIESKILPSLIRADVTNQLDIDNTLITLDGTEHKTELGGNTMIGVSIACAKLAAKVQGKNTYEYLRTLIPIAIEENEVPYLYVNLINGGKHSHSDLAFQEYHVIPQTKDIKEAMGMINSVIDELEKVIISYGFSLEKGDEGGYAINTPDVMLPLEILSEAVNNTDLNGKIKFALDVAASSFYEKDIDSYKIGDKNLNKVELKNIYKEICQKYEIISIEDPFFEDDFASFNDLQNEIPTLIVVGDDLTTTNTGRIHLAIEQNSIKGMIIKPNQVGTLTETLQAIQLAYENDIKCIVSHRSGETMDNFIADLVVAFNCFGIKAGSPRAKERAVKYDRLVDILN